jgi:hypothetical protein
MHRLMVTSAAYCQSSFVEADSAEHQKAREADPANDLLWHFRRRRLDAESIRDGMLAVSGQLSLRMFGTSARPELPKGLKSTYAWKPDEKPEDRNRRSVYVFARRNLRLPLLESFDMPDMHNSCCLRANTTTAPQALALLNSEFTLEQARHWTGKLLSEYCECEDETSLIRSAYETVYGRAPAEPELAAALGFVEAQQKTIETQEKEIKPDLLPLPMVDGFKPARAAALVDLCHALLNSNEFLFVD